MPKLLKYNQLKETFLDKCWKTLFTFYVDEYRTEIIRQYLVKIGNIIREGFKKIKKNK